MTKREFIHKDNFWVDLQVQTPISIAMERNTITEQEIVKPYLDKIRAEIEELDGKYVIGDYATYGEHSPKYVQLMEVLRIINKYRERRDKE